MANTLTNIIPQILVGSLPTLREQAIMPRLVLNPLTELGSPASRGSTVDIPLPTAIATRDVTAAVTHATNQDTDDNFVQCVLNQWKEASFHLSDKDAEEVMDGFVPMQSAEAMKAIANGIDSFILGKYTGVYNYGGVGGTTPFASNLNAYKDARVWLNKEAAPVTDRRVVLDPDAEGNAMNLSTFLEADKRGDQRGMIQGEIGFKIGAQWFLEQNVQSHTGGSWAITGTGYTEVKAVATAGTSTLIIQGNSSTTTNGGDLHVGDVFTVDGYDYTVTAQASVEVGTQATLEINVSPLLQTTVAAGATVTIAGGGTLSHAVNLLFHRDAFAFASRPLARSRSDAGGMFMTMPDPISGVAVRLEFSRQYKQNTYSFDSLYGSVLSRASQAARILG